MIFLIFLFLLVVVPIILFILIEGVAIARYCANKKAETRWWLGGVAIVVNICIASYFYWNGIDDIRNSNDRLGLGPAIFAITVSSLVASSVTIMPTIIAFGFNKKINPELKRMGYPLAFSFFCVIFMVAFSSPVTRFFSDIVTLLMIDFPFTLLIIAFPFIEGIILAKISTDKPERLRGLLCIIAPLMNIGGILLLARSRMSSELFSVHQYAETLLSILNSIRFGWFFLFSLIALPPLVFFFGNKERRLRTKILWGALAMVIFVLAVFHPREMDRAIISWILKSF